MTDKTNIVELADELAEIAKTTSDPATGMRLMKIVERLLVEAGLSPPDHEDGGETCQPGGCPNQCVARSNEPTYFFGFWASSFGFCFAITRS